MDDTTESSDNDVEITDVVKRTDKSKELKSSELECAIV